MEPVVEIREFLGRKFLHVEGEERWRKLCYLIAGIGSAAMLLLAALIDRR